MPRLAWYRLPPVRAKWLPSRSDFPGLGLTLAIGLFAAVAIRISPPTPFLSEVLLALLLGIVVVNSPLGRALGLDAAVSGAGAPSRWTAGLGYTGRWILRIAIVLLGLKMQTSFFGRTELVLILGVSIVSIPSAFFVAHTIGRLLGVERPMADLLAGGTMICGASAVNAIAPVVGAKKQDQGIAIGVVFLFSVVAMLSFRVIARAVGLDPSFGGLWSGLAVNDLSSSVAVGAQMGGSGGVMAAAAKSARILMLAPVLVTLSFLRRDPRADGTSSSSGLLKTIRDSLPGFLVGYVALAVVRGVLDRFVGDASWWKAILDANKIAVDLAMSTVSAGIGLHLSFRAILASSGRAVGVGGGASLWMAGVTLALMVAVARGQSMFAIGLGVGSLAVSYAFYRTVARRAYRPSR